MKDFDELDELLGALREGTIEDGQVARLDQLLAEHPEALDRFVGMARLRSDLEYKIVRRASVASSLPAAPRRRFRFAVAAAALVAISLLAALLARTPPAEAGPSYDGCAVLARTLDPKWEGSAPAEGNVLPKGRLRLSSGWAQIEFFAGARVILEGPAEFDLLSSREARCISGKLRAFVPPPAAGFSIRAAGMTLIDQGTEFGLLVEPSGVMEVHVFQGKLELHRDRSPLTIGAGEALRVDASGGAASRPTDPRVFVTPSELAVRSTEEARERLAHWRASSERLRRDPRTVLYFAFEDADESTGDLLSHRSERSELDGAIIGCRWAEGRWPQKRALEFKRPGDRVRFRGAGSYESITLMAWLRVDGLDRPFSGLMLTDGWTTGSVHWQITQNGALRLGIHGQGVAHDYDSPVLFEAAQLGRWTHLCTVHDRAARVVTHYADGRKVREIPLRFDTALILGSAELGNWGDPLPGWSTKYAIRNLNGRLDEFAIFGAALREEEIRGLYAAGTPGP